jgi:hypothetical protein
MKRVLCSISALITVSALLLAACGDDDDEKADDEPDRPDDTGAACMTADQCYPNVAEGMLQGEAHCLEEARDGYCTHTCASDDDCCAVTGECKTDLAQVCAAFTSTDETWCFLSCEPADVDDAMYADANEYCQREASRDFICRASGGGAPKKICMPVDCDVGADCGDDADCAGGLTCVTGFDGGYCTVTGCASNADCPADSLCVVGDGQNYCFKTCAAASDCSFCRASNVFSSCSDEVTFAEDGTSGTVCVPP